MNRGFFLGMLLAVGGLSLSVAAYQQQPQGPKVVVIGRSLLYPPDEKTDLSDKEKAVREPLEGAVRRWLGEEDYWMVYAHGDGEFAADRANVT